MQQNDSITILIVNRNEITGNDYRITFTEDCLDATWNLINATTGDTVLADQYQFDGDASTFPIADGMQIIIRNPRIPDDYFQSGFAVADIIMPPGPERDPG